MIRKAERADIPALMDIYNDAVLHTTATFDTEIKDRANREAWYGEHTGHYVLFVCEEGREIVGYASLSRYRDRKAFDQAVELSVYVRGDARGRGVGRELMREILSAARACGEIATVISLITSENEASIRLHESFGFVYCGQIQRAGVKFGRTLNLNAYQIVFDR